MKETYVATAVALPTEKETNLIFCNLHKEFHYWDEPTEPQSMRSEIGQFLYLISDDEVKKGDFCLHRVQHEYHLTKAYGDNAMEHYKIVGSTDKSLYISLGDDDVCIYDIPFPQVPESIVKRFAESNGDEVEFILERGVSANGTLMLAVIEDPRQKMNLSDRKFDAFLFHGNGDKSVRLMKILIERLEEGHSQLSGMQQSMPTDDPRYIEGVEFNKDVCRDILASFGFSDEGLEWKELPYPGILNGVTLKEQLKENKLK